ncbi:MAG: DUF362 domain-containing protein [Planctomycetota bacterium]
MHQDRRRFMVGGIATASALGSAAAWHHVTRPVENVFVARNQSYDGDLVRVIEDGFRACEFDLNQVRDRRVLLKPNLVEPKRTSPHMTTHPAIIQAAAEVFRSYGAIVTVGEGPGHVRDTEQALLDSGVMDALVNAELTFEDLNYQAVAEVKNVGRACQLKSFFFPRAVIEADFIVSLPKMKTHHWMGVTGAMKNLYGVIPGCKYGWPKNVLHYNGIPQTVFDINASAGRLLTIIDGIDCMEGDGPILGTKKHMGLLLVSDNLPAADATMARLMDVVPERIPYLALAADRLGPISEDRVIQRGESWQPLVKSFEILDRDHLRHLRESGSHFVS